MKLSLIWPISPVESVVVKWCRIKINLTLSLVREYSVATISYKENDHRKRFSTRVTEQIIRVEVEACNNDGVAGTGNVSKTINLLCII